MRSALLLQGDDRKAPVDLHRSGAAKSPTCTLWLHLPKKPRLSEARALNCREADVADEKESRNFWPASPHSPWFRNVWAVYALGEASVEVPSELLL